MAIDSDREHLIENDDGLSTAQRILRKQRDNFRKHKCAIFLGLGVALIAATVLTVYLIFFRCSFYNCNQLKLVALNTWGMPATFGSEYKTERMAAIAKKVAKGDFDLFLLEELWMQPDHETIASSVPEGFHMTGFRQLALASCDGRVAPTACSGLAIVSRFPFVEIEFNSYTYHGDPMKILVDGEWLARKGVGRVRIQPVANVTFDVFITHTAADPDPIHGYNNSYYRVRQVRELMDTYVSKSDADIVLLGGDFNAEPLEEKGSPYQMIREHMKNCVEDIFYKLEEWLNAKFATYGNKANTFSGNKYSPVTYDYIFHRTNNVNRTNAWTNWFDLPLFKLKIFADDLEDANATNSSEAGETNLTREERSAEKVEADRKEREISFSDHEAVESTLYFWT